jgi:DNA-binding IclR family transcriptional regulator
MSQLKTLDRGIAALKEVAARPGGLSLAALAATLGVHKAIAYRIVATLEGQGLVARLPGGEVVLGGGVLALAARFEPQFRAAAAPLLATLAREMRATACIAAAEGEDCVVLMVSEAEDGFLRVAYRLGSRHPLTLGATGIALLSGRAARPGEPEAVAQARADGFSVTRGELQRGAVGLAVPVLQPEDPRVAIEPCVGVVAMDELDTGAAARAVSACARRLRPLLLEPSPEGGT